MKSFWVVVSILILNLLSSGASAGEQDQVRFTLPDGYLEQIDISEAADYLSSISSRVTGSPGCYEASRYIQKRFRDIGLENVQVQEFTVPVPADHGGSLSVDDTPFELHALWPNLARAPKTSSEGIKGHLFYAADGEVAKLDGLDLAGGIALMDFNCGMQWLTVAQFGAKALVFIEPENTFRKEAEDKFLSIPASLPRYYITQAQLAGLLSKALGKAVTIDGIGPALDELNAGKKVQATVRADILWENQTAQNIVGTIVGTDPELRAETLVIEAFYDSISVVPSIAPGAESTGGIAALLEIAEALKAHPPKRTVRILATAGHFQALAGMRNWCREYWVWENLMTNCGIGEDNKLFAPPKSVWTPPEDGVIEWEPAEHPIMYACLDFSSRTNQMGIFFKGNFYNIGSSSDKEVIYRKKFSEIGSNAMEVADQIIADKKLNTSFVSCIDPIRGRDWRSYLPDNIALDNEVPLMYGKGEVGFVTVNDARSLVDTPLDTMDQVDRDSVLQQAKLSAGLIWNMANRKYEIPMCDPLARELYVTMSEDSLINFLQGSPLPNALLAVEMHPEKTLMGVHGMAYGMSDQEGKCLVVGVKQNQVPYTPFRADRRDGSIEFINKKTVMWQTRVPAVNAKDWVLKRTSDSLVPLFECSATLMFDLMDELTYKTFNTATVLDAKRDSEPRNSAVFIGQPAAGASYAQPCGVVFAERSGDNPIKVIVSGGVLGSKFTLLNSTDAEDQDKSQGVGYTTSEREHRITLTSYHAARDMWRLDEFRLSKLKSTGVKNERAEFLHKLAGQRLEKAQKALDKKEYVGFLNNAREAWAYEARAYPNVRGAADDVIKALIFYLAVLLPFSVFGERLFFGFTDIRNRLLGVAGIFAAIYGIMNYVHPGFQLSATPIIILAGFFMLVLGVVTIGILIGKFNTQMALMREKTGTWHRQDVNRSSAAGAAFMLGISNLRRRKTRTLLTCITLVLLTFTVLSFTSFETSVAPNEIPTTYKSTYKGVLIRRRDWTEIKKHASIALKDYFQMRKASIAERTWYSKDDPTEPMHLDVIRPDDGKQFQSRGMLGLDPIESKLTKPQACLLAGEWFDPASQPDYPYVCIVPASMAAKEGGLNISKDDVGKAKVTILGKTLRVIGILDDDKFNDLRDLDNEQLTPVDYIEQAAKDRSKGSQKEKYSMSSSGQLEMLPEEKPPEQYSHIDPAAILFAPNDFVQNLHNAKVRSVAIGLNDLQPEDISNVMRDYVPRIKLILFAGLGEEGVKLFSSRDALSAKGMKGIFLLILIASLIVFNTMLGSVYERLNEIAVYTSCGLAPVHVASLFLAESSVFATMGAVVGYLLGQGIAKYVSYTGQLSGINLNYSSVSAVATILLVVGVVLLSTLYPARKAVQLSVPDETKKIKLPQPDGDTWRFDFPFTVSQVEALGLNAFIYEYFSSHNEDSGGVFCADRVSLSAQEEERGRAYVFDSNVWIEPMDMGISQKVTLKTSPPPPDDKVCTIQFTIQRLSGEVDSWRRMNYGFLKAIRKQMLIWRLVDNEHKAQFDQQGKEYLSKSEEV